MNHPEYTEYKQFENEIRDTLESQYNMCMFNNDFAGAYEVLGKLMAYKLIEKDDARIESNNKTYVKAGIEKSHRFRLDYRRDYGYIPDWLFGQLDYMGTCKCSTIEHWGKRVEGNYEGDTVFPSRVIDIRFTLCNTTRKIENAFDGISSLMKEHTGKVFNRSTLEGLCKNGVYRVYSIEVESSCISSFKNIGYAIIKMGESGINTVLVLQYSSFIGNWLPIKSSIQTIENTIKQLIHSESSFNLAIPCDNALETQRGKVNASNAMDVSRSKLDSEQKDKKGK